MIVDAEDEDEAMEMAESMDGWEPDDEDYYDEPIPEIRDAEEID